MPLNKLKLAHPDLYIQYSEKYKDREFVMQRKIPILNCLWNDVIQFSPVEPDKIKSALLSVGFYWHPKSWYKFDTNILGLSPDNAAIWDFPVGHEAEDELQIRDMRAFTPEAMHNLTELPEAALAVYQQAKVNGEKPLLFKHIPHIFIKGEVEIASGEIITC
jgi:hypothetical protein